VGFILEFDSKNNILRARLEGRVTDRVLSDCYAAAARYTASHPPVRGGIWSFVEVTTAELSGHAMRKLAATPPILPPGYIRVVVAPSDSAYGMSRMFQMLTETTRPDLRVVRTMDEAYSLLGVESPEFSPVSSPEP